LRLTAIAAQGPRDVFGVAKFYVSDFTFERSGDWTIMYGPGTSPLAAYLMLPVGLMPISELEAQLATIARLSPSVQNSAGSQNW